MERPSEFRLLLQSKEQELINLCDQQIQSLHTRVIISLFLTSSYASHIASATVPGGNKKISPYRRMRSVCVQRDRERDWNAEISILLIREKEKVEANLAAQISQLQDDFKVGPWIAETMIELFGAVTGEVDSQLGRQTDAFLALRSIIFHYWILEMLSLHSMTQQRLHSRLDVRSTLLQTLASFS
ncbi:unnamed protein product [Sphagnum jensenii]|uniref:Uncharacterized protein n=1 Tax=Sphagnum jensenii TaxID=128206 RepID=A0ABP1BDD6_9BRYO